MRKISFQAEIDSKKAQRQLDNLKRKIANTTSQLNEATASKSAIEEQLNAASKKADETKAKIQELKAELNSNNVTLKDNAWRGVQGRQNWDLRNRNIIIKEQLAQQEELLKGQNREVATLTSQWTRADSKVSTITTKLEQQQTAAGKLEQQIGSTFDPSKLKQAGSNIKTHLAGGFKTVLKYVLGIRSMYILFRLIRSAITSGIQEMAKYDKQTAKTVNNLKNSVTKLKNSLANAFAPLLQAVAPVLTKIINMLTKAINYAGMLVAALTGQKTYKMLSSGTDAAASSTKQADDADKKHTKTIKNKTKAVKEQIRYLSGLDEIQTYTAASAEAESTANSVADKIDDAINDSDLSAGIQEGIENAITGAVQTVEIPEELQKKAGWIREHIDDIKSAALAAGAAFVTWKAAKFAGLGLKAAAGWALAIAGGMVAADAATDMWKNQITDKNLTKYLIGAAAAAAGVALIIGSWAGVAAGGWALVAAGAVLLGVVIAKNWDKIKDATKKACDKVKNLFVRAWDGVKNKVKTTAGIVKDWFTEHVQPWFTKEKWQTLAEKAKDALERYIAPKKEAVKSWYERQVKPWFSAEKWKGLADTARAYIEKSITPTSGAQSAWSKMRSTLSSIWDAINLDSENGWFRFGYNLREKWNSLMLDAENFGNVISSKLSGAWDRIKTNAEIVWEAIRRAIVDPLNAAKNAVESIIAQIKSVTATSGMDISMPHIAVDWYARGGIVSSPTLIGAGEAGKEAIIPLERHTEWISMVADGLADILDNRIAEYMVRTPMPAAATGGLIPPRMTVDIGGLDGLRSDVQDLAKALENQRSEYQFTAQINRRTLFDEMVSEAKLRQSASGKNPFNL